MSKAVTATCLAHVVKIDDLPVSNAVVLSQGTKSSTGLAVIDGEHTHYLTSNAADIADLIDQLIAVVNQLVTTLTAIGASMTGPTTAPPPTLPTDLVSLTSVATQLTAMKVNLK